MVHFPWAGFVAIDAGRQRADGTDVNARAALIALEMITVRRRDLANHAAIDDAERTYSVSLAADANTAVAQDTARGVEEDYWRKLLLIDMMLNLRKPALAGSVPEHH